jgi:uncharacterized OsmC-like protein
MDKVVVQQNRDFQIEIWTQREREDELRQVAHIHELSPYTMMLASLAMCTCVVIQSYAQHHNVDLEVVNATTVYHREDANGSSGAEKFEEWIEETVDLEGDLSDDDRKRLAHVGHQCSIRKMLESGIEIRTS